MNIAIFSYYQIFNKKNKLFDPSSYPIGENLDYPFALLKEELYKMNVNLNTIDQYSISDIDKVIFLDYPTKNKKLLKALKKNNVSLYLVINECEIIKSDNWNKKNHALFNKIFTWDDRIVDNKKYFKFYLPNKISRKMITTNKNNFCTMIAGNKTNNDYRELYSARAEIVDWFEQFHMDEFDLYGIGWDVRKKHGHSFFKRAIRFKDKVFNNFYSHLTEFKCSNTPAYNCYKGKIDNKKNVLSNYKFSICYENACDIPGYITEKIFDCFFSGCVPVYWGAPDITEFIPANCFIDKRNFITIESLYSYMKNLSDDEYQEYIDNISDFLISDKINLFSAEYFVEIIKRELLQ